MTTLRSTNAPHAMAGIAGITAALSLGYLWLKTRERRNDRHLLPVLALGERRLVELSKLEKAYADLSLRQFGSPYAMHFAIVLRTSTPAETSTRSWKHLVERAFEVLQRRHAMLRCVIGRRPENGDLVLVEDDGVRIPVYEIPPSEQVMPEGEQYYYRRIFELELENKQFSLGDAPLVVHVITHESTSTSPARASSPEHPSSPPSSSRQSLASTSSPSSSPTPPPHKSVPSRSPLLFKLPLPRSGTPPLTPTPPRTPTPPPPEGVVEIVISAEHFVGGGGAMLWLMHDLLCLLREDLSREGKTKVSLALGEDNANKTTERREEGYRNDVVPSTQPQQQEQNSPFPLALDAMVHAASPIQALILPRTLVGFLRTVLAYGLPPLGGLVRMPRSPELYARVPMADFCRYFRTASAPRALTREKTAALIVECRKHKVTVTTALSACFALAFHELFGEGGTRRRITSRRGGGGRVVKFYAVADVAAGRFPDSRTPRSLSMYATGVTPICLDMRAFVPLVRGEETTKRENDTDDSPAWAIAAHVRRAFLSEDFFSLAAQAHLPLAFVPSTLFTGAVSFSLSSFGADDPISSAAYAPLFRVAQLEFKQNLQVNCWPHVAAHTADGRLAVTVHAQTPRFEREDMIALAEVGLAKLRGLAGC